MKLSGMREGLRVLILGAGTIGKLIGRTARLYGAGYIAMTDLHQSKLDLARGQAGGPGCDEAILVSRSTTVQDIKRTVGEHSIDVAFGCMMYNNGDFSFRPPDSRRAEAGPFHVHLEDLQAEGGGGRL
jgi:threonine dehydrogenase-like Zn-dependent dehydrogenase